MTEIGFYHLTKTPLEKALPNLLEKILESRNRTLILCASQERLDYLNGALWTYGRASFIPHGTTKDGNSKDQPIWLTTEDENPNDAQFLILTDGIESPSLPSYARCLDLFDGNDNEAVLHARNRWKKYNDAGHTLTYWRQKESGTWEKGA